LLEHLGGLLRRCRARIGQGRASLGMYLRAPMRVGKAVTQEEVADAVGITRQWYAMLEGDHHPVRVSATILGRIADALMMDTVERASLFQLAIPEIRSASLTERSAAVLEAIAPFRSLTRSLWAASTEEEALTTVLQYGMTQLAADMTGFVKRVGEGEWDVASDPHIVDRSNRAHALLRERWGPAALDDFYCYALMPQPGDLLTLAERDARFPHRAATDHAVLETVGWTPDFSWAIATVRTQNGFVGRLAAGYQTAHAYSEIECAQLSTLADIASLALSGRI
jgi:transcriptional regulator with XRE-family HTH domain